MVILLATPAAERKDNLAVVLLGPALVAVGILVVSFLMIRHRADEPQLIAGADVPTRRAVQRALRAGGTTDPRIDALTRDAAAHWVRNTWLPWIFGANLLLQMIVLVSRVLDGDDRGDILLSAALVTAFVLLQTMLLLNRRRSRRYLATTAPQP